MKNLLLIGCMLIGLPAVAAGQTFTYRWARGAMGAGFSVGYGLSIDTSGNSYVTGYLRDAPAIFGSDTLADAGNGDLFVVKYDRSGIIDWAKRAGGNGYDAAFAIATDASGNAYVTGTFGSPNIGFGRDTLTNGGGDDIFVVRYDRNGNAIWAKRAGGNDFEAGYGIGIDPAGNCYIAGRFSSSSLTFGASSLINAGGSDMFIASYDANGNPLWAKSAGGESDDFALGLAVDGSGNSYVTGIFFSPAIVFGADTLLNNTPASSETFIAKYDASGNVQWATSAQGTERNCGQAIAVDSAGNSYVTGYFEGATVVFGSDTLYNVHPGSGDIFVVKLDKNGHVEWAKSAGGTSDDIATGISVDPWGFSYITGYFNSYTVDFGTTTLTNALGSFADIFVVRYDTTGSVVWATATGGTSDDYGRAVAADPSGNCYVTGNYASSSVAFGSDTMTTNNSAMYIAKIGSASTSVQSSRMNLPSEFSFSQNYPNPFNPSTRITYGVPAVGKVVMRIYDVLGRNVATLVNEVKQAGTYTVTWDASNLPSGLYLCRMVVNRFTETQKMLLIR